MEAMKIIATGLPASVEDYELALNATFAGGIAYGQANTQEFKRNSQAAEKELEDAAYDLAMAWSDAARYALVVGTDAGCDVATEMRQKAVDKFQAKFKKLIAEIKG